MIMYEQKKNVRCGFIGALYFDNIIIQNNPKEFIIKEHGKHDIFSRKTK